MMLAILRVLKPIHETEGLQYLHGDISPENIIYVPSNDAAVFIDFGNAQRLGQDGRALVARGELSYNPVFMSPEIQAFVASRRETVSLSKASDIYSLGLILYGLLFEAPDRTNSEHIAILVRNRINSNERSDIWSRTVARLMMDLFESCLAADEESRIQDLAELSSRLSEIRNLLGNTDITKAGMRYRLLERSASYVPNDRFPVSIEDENGYPVDLDGELSNLSAHAPIVLFGIRGGGKTTFIRAAAHRLLETEGVVPIVIDTGELKDALSGANVPQALATTGANVPQALATTGADMPQALATTGANVPQALATTVYRNVFGHRDPPKPHVVTKLVAILGLCATDNSAVEDAPASGGLLAFAEGGRADFVVFVDNIDLLEDSPDAMAQLANVVRSTTKTRFVLCGNGRMFIDTGLSCSIRPLSVQEVQESLRRDLNLKCPRRYAETLATPALLALLYEEFTDKRYTSPLDVEELVLGRLYPVLERFYRYGQDLRFEELSRLAYSLLTVARRQTLSLPANTAFTRWLLCEGAIRPAPNSPTSDRRASNRQDAGSPPSDGQDNYLFRSSLVGDFFASHLVAQIIRRATHATHLSGINHIWHRGLIDMLSALPAETLATLTAKMQGLTEDIGVAEAFRCDLIPSNMFALTGDELWATLSMRLADSLFHETILDGYFAYRFEIVLANDAEREHPVRYNLLDSDISALRTQLPPRLIQALIADLRYGYRLPHDPELADRLASRLLEGR
jgi:hypothetical protein